MEHWVRRRVLTTAGLVVAVTLPMLTACSSSSKPSAESTTTYPAATMVSSASAGTTAPASSTPAAPSRSVAPTSASLSASTSLTSKPAAPASTARPKPAQPTVPADVPRTGPNVTSRAEKPPVMPIEATKHTSQGAKAFAEFFVRTIDWGYATTDGSYMRHYFDKSCRLCAAFANDFDQTKAARYHYVGDRLHIISPTRNVMSNVPKSQYTYRIQFNVDAFSSVDPTGKIYKAGAPIRGAVLASTLRWQHQSWTIVALRNRS